MPTLYFQPQGLLTPSSGQLNQTVLSDAALSFCRTTTTAVIENSSHKAVVALSEKIRAKLISIFDEFSRPELLEYNASRKSEEPVFTKLEKGKFISNFINREKDHSPFNPVYYSLILRRYCRVFDEFMNADSSSLNSEEIQIQAKLQNEGFSSTQFNEEEKAKLENILIDRFVKGKDGNYLYTDKLISVVGFLMELPGDSAVPLEHDGRISETENNKKLIALFDLPLYLVNRSGHPTYGLEILKDCDGSPITIGNLFGGGLQGVFRDPMTSHLPNPNDAAIDLGSETLFKSKYKITHKLFKELQKQVFNPEIKLNSGSTHFIYNENKEMTNQIGADLFQYAMKINKKLKKEGNFTAGVSGNAMHCAIEARRYALSVNEKLSKEAVIATCKNHLCPVTDDPLHHSELEVWIGANLGWDLYDYAIGESFESYQALFDRVKEVVDSTFDSYKEEQAFCTRITQHQG